MWILRYLIGDTIGHPSTLPRLFETDKSHYDISWSNILSEFTLDPTWLVSSNEGNHKITELLLHIPKEKGNIVLPVRYPTRRSPDSMLADY